MLYSENVGYLEDVVRAYLKDPNSVDASWRTWLEGAGREFLDAVAPAAGPAQKPASLYAPKNGHAPGVVSSPDVGAFAAGLAAQVQARWRHRARHVEGCQQGSSARR